VTELGKWKHNLQTDKQQKIAHVQYRHEKWLDISPMFSDFSGVFLVYLHISQPHAHCCKDSFLKMKKNININTRKTCKNQQSSNFTCEASNYTLFALWNSRCEHYSDSGFKFEYNHNVHVWHHVKKTDQNSRILHIKYILGSTMGIIRAGSVYRCIAIFFLTIYGSIHSLKYQYFHFF
jgi:hypothetical protein